MQKSRINKMNCPPKADSSFLTKSKILRKIEKLPKTPGVYIFKNESGVVLYVGKATSLRSRVGSYSSLPSVPSGYFPSGRGGGIIERPVDYAISQIKDIKIIETNTVLEAYILEQDLIKRLQPKYNAMGKDDKSFTYVVITKEQFPRILLLRKTELEKIFNSKLKINQSSAFPLLAKARNSSKPSFSSNTKYQIQYTKIYGPYTSKKQVEIALKILRKIFPYHSKPQKSERGCLEAQIGLCPGPYEGKISSQDYLRNIRGIRMILEGKKKGLVKKLEKEMKVFSKNHEYEKAAEMRNKIFALRHIQDIALISDNKNILSLSPILFLKEGGSMENIIRIEAYDISNISGQYAVGSMVVFDNSNGVMVPNKNEYRKFKIKTIQGADDVGMMQEVLIRRFNNNWPRPSLILLDGGMGHLHMAEELFKNLKLNIPLAAVAKNENRKGIKYYVSSIMYNDKFKFLLSNKNLIKQIMDEAHRFAIAYHKKVRRREFISYN